MRKGLGRPEKLGEKLVSDLGSLREYLSPNILCNRYHRFLDIKKAYILLYMIISLRPSWIIGSLVFVEADRLQNDPDAGRYGLDS